MEELRDFVREEEQRPKKALYPRDPSLDPQLVWKGKDEEDSKPLEVPAVPIYIQEKIHPQAVVKDIRTQAKKQKPEQQPADDPKDNSPLGGCGTHPHFVLPFFHTALPRCSPLRTPTTPHAEQ